MALNKEVWINQIKEKFYPEDSFLKAVTDLSEFVDNDKIHMPSAGIDPQVLVNNTTYPISIVKREDDDFTAVLDKLETVNTIVRRPDELEYSYDKLESVIRQHRSTLRTAAAKKALHAFAPQKDGLKTPVIETTGELCGTRKRLTFVDILTLKERFDDAEIPFEKRCLILHPKHVTDLLLEDMALFKDLTELKDGNPNKFGGFSIYQFPYCPKYELVDGILTKQDLSSEIGSFASVAFQGDEVMKADGQLYMYSREDDPEHRGTIVGFDKRFIALPIRGMGIGAIVSGK